MTPEIDFLGKVDSDNSKYRKLHLYNREERNVPDVSQRSPGIKTTPNQTFIWTTLKGGVPFQTEPKRRPERFRARLVSYRMRFVAHSSLSEAQRAQEVQHTGSPSAEHHHKPFYSLMSHVL